MKKYKLDVNEKQLKLIRRALDFYSRMSCGQFDEVLQLESIESYLEHRYDKDWYDIGGKKEIAESFLNDAKNNLTNLSPNASWGIHNDIVSDAAYPMYEIKKTIDHHLWLERDKNSEFEGFVKHNVDSRPFFAIKIETLNNDEDVQSNC